MIRLSSEYIYCLSPQEEVNRCGQSVWIIWSTVSNVSSQPFCRCFTNLNITLKTNTYKLKTSIILLNEGKLQNVYIHNVTNIDCLYILLVLIESKCNLFEFWWHFVLKNVISLLYGTLFFFLFLCTICQKL